MEKRTLKAEQPSLLDDISSIKFFEKSKDEQKTGKTNTNLNVSKKAGNDDFFTMARDVSGELDHYKRHFFGKTVYCNCDNPFHSNFTRYFLEHFNEFGLERLISTSYSGYSDDVFQGDLFNETEIPENIHGLILDVTEVPEGADLDKFIKNNTRELKGNGDFGSAECVEYLHQADICVTNPPFSEAIRFFNLLLTEGHDFIVLGTHNMAKTKELFPHVVTGRVKFGVNAGEMKFVVPTEIKGRTNIRMGTDGKLYASFANILWFTTLDHDVEVPFLELSETYSPEKYPKYDGYDAIDVPGYGLIPKDYDGIMGVPLTILRMLNPKQFRIVGEFNHGKDNEFDLAVPVVEGKEKFPRIAIQRVN